MGKVKKGDKLRVDFMAGEPHYTNKEGIVEHVDDAGQIHGTWGGLAIIPGKDQFTILEQKKEG